MKLRAIGLSVLTAAMLHATPAFAADTVTWINVANASVSGGTLTKSSGCDGCGDSGGKSQQSISGDGFVLFTVTDASKLRFVSLSSSATELTVRNFTWRIEAGNAEIYESGAYKSGTTAVSTDTLKIAVEQGVVKYYKNRTLVYTSLVTPVPSPLYMSAALYAAASAVNNAQIQATTTSSFLCGLKDDTRNLLPANYDSFTPPSQGSSYTDANFNCSVKRLTNGMSQFNGPARHNYANMSPFNANSTRLLLQTSTSFFVTDLNGTIVKDTATLGIGTNDEALWSRSNSSLIYYHHANEIRSYDISTGNRATLATLSALTNVSFGNGEADLSDDGRYVAVIGKDSNYVPQTIQVFDLSTSTLQTGMTIPTGEGLDWCDMTSGNAVLCSWNFPGTARYRGVELYTTQMSFMRQVIPFIGHSDRGKDANGDDILVMEASGDTAPPTGCAGNGVEKIRVSGGTTVKTCLMPTYWQDGAHISVNGPHGYALIEGMHTGGTTNSPAPQNWQTAWGTYYNEIDLVALDGSHIWRFVHHRSRLFSGCYYCQPRAAISPDGKWIVFDSNFNAQPVADYNDVYLIQIKGS